MKVSVSIQGYSFASNSSSKIGPEVDETMGATADSESSSTARYIALETLKLLETDVYPTQDQPQINVLDNELFLLLEEDRETGFLYIEKRLDIPNQNGNYKHAVFIEVEKMENNERMITVELYHDDEGTILSTVQFKTNYDAQSDTYTYKEGTAFFNKDEARQNIEHFFRYQPVQ